MRSRIKTCSSRVVHSPYTDQKASQRWRRTWRLYVFTFLCWRLLLRLRLLSSLLNLLANPHFSCSPTRFVARDPLGIFESCVSNASAAFVPSPNQPVASGVVGSTPEWNARHATNSCAQRAYAYGWGWLLLYVKVTDVAFISYTRLILFSIRLYL
jgi:hypothetical protein